MYFFTLVLLATEVIFHLCYKTINQVGGSTTATATTAREKATRNTADVPTTMRNNNNKHSTGATAPP
jgi:hypothetical protein